MMTILILLLPSIYHDLEKECNINVDGLNKVNDESYQFLIVKLFIFFRN